MDVLSHEKWLYVNQCMNRKEGMNAKQCKQLVDVMALVRAWIEICGSTVSCTDFEAELTRIHSRGLVLLHTCCSDLDPGWVWLKRSVLHEESRVEFLRVFRDFLQAFQCLVMVTEDQKKLLGSIGEEAHQEFDLRVHADERRSTTSGGTLELRIQQAKLIMDRLTTMLRGLTVAAHLDRQDLISRLDKVSCPPLPPFQEERLHQQKVRELALFLLHILKANTPSAAKEARRLINIDATDIVFERMLGEGAQGYVFEATWKVVLSNMAVKRNMMELYHGKELEALVQANHVNVMRIIAYSLMPPLTDNPEDFVMVDSMGMEPDLHESNLLLMEYMQSGNLEAVIDELGSQHGGTSGSWSGPFPLAVTIDILLQIARGIKYLHKKHIAHRDLKPTNILLDQSPLYSENFTVKIADFGSSRTLFDHTTLATAPVGTRRYMAPELLRAHGVDSDAMPYNGKKVDMYSYGMTCYKVVTGCDPPFQGERPVLGETCPPELVYLMERCWDMEPRNRPTASGVYKYLVLFKYIVLLTWLPLSSGERAYYTNVSSSMVEKLRSYL